MKKVVFFWELYPKTIHGASISNTLVVKKLSEFSCIECIEEYSPITSHKKFSFKKVAFFFHAYRQFLKAIAREKFHSFYGVIYLSFSGIIKNILIVYSFKIKSGKSEVILHFHRSDFIDFVSTRINYLLFKLLDRVVSRYIVLSDFQLKEISQFTRNSIDVLPNTVETGIQVQPYNYFSDDGGLNENCIIKALFLSNYIEDKGIIETIRAVNELNNSNELFNVELNCYGQFTNSVTQQKIFELLKDSKGIKINPPIYGMEKFKTISESHLLILPSKNEGLPLVLLESISLGIPIIISKVGFIPEVLGDKYPYYCNPNDYKTIIERIRRYTLTFNFSLRNELIKKFEPYSSHSHSLFLKKIFANES